MLVRMVVVFLVIIVGCIDDNDIEIGVYNMYISYVCMYVDIYIYI